MFPNSRNLFQGDSIPQEKAQIPVLWKAPQKGLYKIHVEIKNNIGRSMSLIVCDSQGEVITTTIKFMESELEPRVVEAYAFRWASSMVVDLCLQGVTFETNCLHLSQA